MKTAKKRIPKKQIVNWWHPALNFSVMAHNALLSYSESKDKFYFQIVKDELVRGVAQDTPVSGDFLAILSDVESGEDKDVVIEKIKQLIKKIQGLKGEKREK